MLLLATLLLKHVVVLQIKRVHLNLKMEFNFQTAH